MIDSQNFIKNSLFCEWGYIINLDDNTLEIWKGFQQKSQKNNRYGCEKWEGYYPCKNIKKIKLEEIKKANFRVKSTFFRKIFMEHSGVKNFLKTRRA